MKRIVTLNSVYEVDEEKKVVRRAENSRHVHEHPLASEDWKPYISYREAANGSIVFSLPEDRWVMTSTVQHVEDV